jgi:hypothetical protein
MAEDSLERLIVLFSAGIGLALFGGIRFLVPSRSPWLRYSIVLVALAGCASVAVALGSAKLAVWAAAVVGVGSLLVSVAGSASAATLCRFVTSQLRRPAVQAVALLIGGIVLIGGSLAQYSAEEEARIEEDMAWLREIGAVPPLRSEVDLSAETDLGETITLKAPVSFRPTDEMVRSERRLLEGMGFGDRLLRLGPASDVCNCHGWVFTGGKYWIGPEEVEKILSQNGYQPVSDPRPGDVVIYYAANMISHTAVVRSVRPSEGVLVEGKWGWTGVFLHRVDNSCYGKQFTYFRAPRAGHVLVGLDGSSPPARDRAANTP